MATDVVINGETHSGVEAVNLMKTDGTTEQFYPDAVRYVAQTLTEEQKAQARENIGIANAEYGGYYTPSVKKLSPDIMRVYYTPSKSDMPAVAAQDITLPRGADSTIASITESEESGGENVVIFESGETLRVHNGQKGEDGKNGDDGFSPIVEDNSDFVGGIQFTITDKNGPHTFTVRDGENGESVRIADVIESEDSGGANVVEFSDGTTFAVRNGKKGASPVKGVDYWTDEDKKEIAEEAITDEVMQQLISMLATPVFGTVDAENNIILSGKLVNGTYTFKYETDDGELVTIGTITQTTGGATSIEIITPVWVKGKKINKDTGEITDDAFYAYSENIPFEDGTEIHISCSDSSDFHCHWYYYDENDNYIGNTQWMETNTGAKPEEVLTKKEGAVAVKLRCNTVHGEWTDLDRLTVTRVYL
jgi:hypothetical protein